MRMMFDYDIWFYEAFEEEEQALKRYLPEEARAGFTWKTIQEAGHTQPPAPVICTRTQSIYPRQWATLLQAILSRSTGYDHLLRYREETGFSAPMGHLPLYCNRAVAEQALLLWLALMRRLPRQQAQFHRFERDGLTGREMGGKTVAVFGVGNIGYQVADIARSLGMTVRGVDIDPRHRDIDYVTPEQAAENADIIVAAMNLTRENAGYFNRDFWERCKPGALFVNISRGELSPITILEEALEKGRLAGLALDVFNHEKQLAACLRDGAEMEDEEVQALMRLAEKDTVILTPHNAFNTEESVARKSEQTVRQWQYFKEHGRFLWPV